MLRRKTPFQITKSSSVTRKSRTSACRRSTCSTRKTPHHLSSAKKSLLAAGGAVAAAAAGAAAAGAAGEGALAVAAVAAAGPPGGAHPGVIAAGVKAKLLPTGRRAGSCLTRSIAVLFAAISVLTIRCVRALRARQWRADGHGRPVMQVDKSRPILRILPDHGDPYWGPKGQRAARRPRGG
jgi:hypothetical protein